MMCEMSDGVVISTGGRFCLFYEMDSTHPWDQLTSTALAAVAIAKFLRWADIEET